MTETKQYYGILTNLQTGSPIRPATCEEWLISVRLVQGGQPEGAFLADDGQEVFVAGVGENEPRCICGAPADHAEHLQQLIAEEDRQLLTAEQVDELRRIAVDLSVEHKRNPWTGPEAAYLAAIEYMAGRTNVRKCTQKLEVARARKEAAQSAELMVIHVRDAAMLAALRGYTGDDVWRDVVRPHEDYVPGSWRSDPAQFCLTCGSRFWGATDGQWHR